MLELKNLIESINAVTIDKILLDESVNDKLHHKAIVMFGPPGAGKSTISDRIRKQYGFVKIDPDQFLDKMIKGNEALPGGEITDTIRGHAVAKTIKMMRDVHLPNATPVIIDTAGTAMSMTKIYYNKLMQNNYDALGIVVHCELRELLKRVKKREMEIGRKTERDYVISAYDDIENNIPALRALFGKNLIIIDNTNGLDELNAELLEKTLRRFISAPLVNFKNS